MSLTISCNPGDAALWSKVTPRRRLSQTRQSRKSWTVSCEKSLRWSPVEDTKHKAAHFEQALEHKMPDTQNMPPWVPFLANMALGAALVITLQRTVFKRAPEYKEKIKETAQDIRHKVAAKAEELQLLSAERMLLAIESIDEGGLEKLFSLADNDHDGRIDLRELAYALAKMNPELPLAEARDSATDFFILFKADAAGGLDKAHFRQFLQCWALLHMEPLYKVAKELEPALSRPMKEVVRSQQDRATQEELDDLARSGDRMRRYVDHKKAETAFRLWDLDSNGRVLREKVVRGLLRVLLDKKQRRGKGAQEVLAALSFLEVEERVGRASLDAAEFRYVLHRFSELARLDPDEVAEGLIQLATANEIGSGPSLKKVKEQEVQEQVGPPPSQSTAMSGGAHDQKGH